MPIEVKKLSCNYRINRKQEIKALEDISFRIQDGEFVGIMGPTGCGKSTLIQLIAGLLRPSAGEILLNGKDINEPRYDRTLLRETVGLVFQHPEYQLFETTVEKDVAFALKQFKLSPEEKKLRVRHALEAMGFDYESIRGKSPLSLSGGEKRRVAIAGVLSAKPSVLIFDEPVAGLDPRGRIEFMELVKKLRSEGVTVLMVSHNADLLFEYADRILVLKDGRLIKSGSPKELLSSGDLDYPGSLMGIAGALAEKGLLPSPVITSYAELLSQLKNRLKAGDAR